MAEAKPYAPALREFVASGGRYVGFCLGAYMAGHDPGFSLLPPSDDVIQEITEPGSQVTDEEDTVIQVDWTFGTGKTEKGRWMYFQDGPAFEVAEGSGTRVLGRYGATGDVAALVCGFGEGWVGCVGPHPEADRAWCKNIPIWRWKSMDFFSFRFFLGGDNVLTEILQMTMKRSRIPMALGLISDTTF